MDLTGARVLVTGGNRGIGRALVEELATRPVGAVLAGVRNRDAFEPVEGGRAPVRPVRMDLSSYETIEKCSADAAAELGAVDVLVNNAGMMTGGLLEEQDTEEVYRLIQVNLVAVIHLTQKVLPGMLSRGHGLIVNNASIGGTRSSRRSAPTSPPRPAWSRSPQRCGASCRAPACRSRPW